MLPGLLYVRACLGFVRGMDELQRRIQLEAWLFAFLGALVISAGLNTLNANGVALGGLSHGLDLGQTVLVTFVLWWVGLGLANRCYK